MPYLTDDVTFDDALDVLSTWSADGLLGMLESGIDIGTVTEMRRNGVSGQLLDSWSSSSIPVDSWKDWMERNISAEAAERFYSRGMDAATAGEWLQPGLSPDDAEALIDTDVPIATVVQWVEAGVAPVDTAAFIGAGVSLEEAQQWIAADISVTDAVDFVRGGVALAAAAEWLEKQRCPRATLSTSWRRTFRWSRRWNSRSEESDPTKSGAPMQVWNSISILGRRIPLINFRMSSNPVRFS